MVRLQNIQTAPITEPASPGLLAPSEILNMVTGQADALLARLGNLGLVGVTGTLGMVRETKYPKHYGIELRDAAGEILYLDIPKSLNPECMTGQMVEAWGFLKFNRNMQVTLKVTRIQLADYIPPEVLKEGLSIRAIFQKQNQGYDDFPFFEGFSISLIHGVSSLVREDFEHQLSGVELEYCPANMKEPTSIAQAIEEATGDIVVIVRGGGNEGDFEVFNNPDILEAWREKFAFKISALGHSQNFTLLDRLSHKVCETPTAAGQYLQEKIEEKQAIRQWQERAKEADKTLVKALQDNAIEFNKKLEALQVELLQEKKSNKIGIIVAVILGFFLCLMLKQ